MNPRTEIFSRAAFNRILLVALAGIALLMACLELNTLSRATRWFDKADVNIQNVVNALALNSAVLPARIDQPGFPSYYLLALDYRIRHELGRPVWNLRRLDASANPIAETADLVRVGREHSRVLVLGMILLAAVTCWLVTRNLEAACLSVVLLAGSAGLLFHGLVNRPELLATAFGTVLAPLFLWLAGPPASRARRHAWLFAAGFACGWAALAELAGTAYLAISFAWCWLAAWSAPATAPAVPARSSITLWLLPLSGSLTTLALLHLLSTQPDPPGAFALLRLRSVAVAVALLPLLALTPSPLRRGSFLRDRLGELALLGGGALATLPLSHLLLRLITPAPIAAEYMTELLQFVFSPGPAMKYLIPTAPHVISEFIHFVRASPFLFAGAAVLAIGTVLRSEIPARLKVFVFLLLANGLVVVVLLSRDRFDDQYSLFAQVPFLLAWVVALHGLGIWKPAATSGGRHHWAAPVALTAALFLLATVPLRLRPQYLADDPAVAGISDATVNYLYNHNTLPNPYVVLMERHYPTRLSFVQALERDLARTRERP